MAAGSEAAKLSLVGDEAISDPWCFCKLPPGGFTESTAQTEPRSACSPRFLVRARGARHQGVAAGRGRAPAQLRGCS